MEDCIEYYLKISHTSNRDSRTWRWVYSKDLVEEAQITVSSLLQLMQRKSRTVW